MANQTHRNHHHHLFIQFIISPVLFAVLNNEHFAGIRSNKIQNQLGVRQGRVQDNLMQSNEMRIFI